jgi:hypothetical protein
MLITKILMMIGACLALPSSEVQQVHSSELFPRHLDQVHFAFTDLATLVDTTSLTNRLEKRYPLICNANKLKQTNIRWCRDYIATNANWKSCTTEQDHSTRLCYHDDTRISLRAFNDGDSEARCEDVAETVHDLLLKCGSLGGQLYLLDI